MKLSTKKKVGNYLEFGFIACMFCSIPMLVISVLFALNMYGFDFLIAKSHYIQPT